MAVVPLCYKMPYKDQNFPIPKIGRRYEKAIICGCTLPLEGSTSRCFSSTCDYRCRCWQCHPFHISSGILTDAVTGNRYRGFNKLQWHLWTFAGIHNTKSHFRPLSRKAMPKENLCPDSGTNESQLRSLDSYFVKLQEDARKTCSVSSNNTTDLLESRIKKELQSLDAYLSKLNEGILYMFKSLYV